MEHIAVGLEMEEYLKTQIFEALQGDIIKSILHEAKYQPTNNYLRNMLEGNSFKVDANISPKLHGIFYDVKSKLGFEEDVDFYVTSDAQLNAYAVSRNEENEPHIININSSLLNLMSDEELRFIIGHEMGHLITKNADLLKLIYFIFPGNSDMPMLLQHKIRLWKQLSELTADRYGYMVCPNVPTCVSAFFKLASGVDLQRVDLNIEAFIADNDKRLEYFKNDKGINLASHPVNLIRIKAIQLFSQSKAFNVGYGHLDDAQLGEAMRELTSILEKIKESELDLYFTHFIAASGVILSGSDENYNEKEIEAILQELSEFIIFPKFFLDNIVEGGKVMEIFNDSL
ncbi:MAG: M48 family metallopeptidase, partial [Lentimicrobium sp.]|nr:M48 family metallopeptidase [Lentimicrobium sp.]